MAVAGGNIEILRLCQQSGLDFSSAAHFAVRSHRHDLFDYFMSASPDSEFDASGLSLVQAAAESGNLRALARLVEAGADPDGASFGLATPLAISVRAGHFLALLPGVALDSGPPMTPVMVAARRGDLALVRLLLERGASPSRTLMTATLHEHAELLQLPDVDPNDDSPAGCPALILAAKRGFEEGVRVLLDDPRVDINLTADGKGNAFAWAIVNKNWTAILC
jgi:ankyrin repeat protein